MISSILQEVLMPVSFGSLLCLMLLYWGQAALFSYTKYSKLTTVLFSFSFISLTTLLILRWVDSGHFPLSNLYESLLFLSWSFLGIQLVAQLTLITTPFTNRRFVQADAMSEPALLLAPTGQTDLRSANKSVAFVSGESDGPHSAELPEPTAPFTNHGFVQAAAQRSCATGWPKRGLNMALAHKFEDFVSIASTPTRISFFKFFEVKPNFALHEVSQRQLLHLLGVITSPMALLTYGFAFLNLPREMQKATALVPALQSNWLMMHVTIMILSYAALLCGSIFSMVFLLLTNLKTSSPLLESVSKPVPKAPLLFTDGPNRNTLTLQLAALPHKKLPKLCFSDRLELHDWARKAHTQTGGTDGRLLGATRASRTKAPLLLEFAKQLKSKANFDQSASVRSQQELALLNSKARFAGDALTELWEGIEPKQNFEKASSLREAWGRKRPLEQELAAASSGPKGLETPYLSLAERLDNYSYRVLSLGFPLLTIGILSGAVWANEAWGSYWSWDPKETWALITWLVFAIYLHARILKGWTGRKPAIIATFGFFVVWFCYLGVNLLGTGLHSYGWFSN